MGRWMPAGMPKVDAFALLIRVDTAVIAAVVDPEAADADPEGPAAGLVVDDVEAIC